MSELNAQPASAPEQIQAPAPAPSPKERERTVLKAIMDEPDDDPAPKPTEPSNADPKPADPPKPDDKDGDKGDKQAPWKKDPATDPDRVPLATLLEERRARQDLQRRLDALERGQPAPAAQAPAQVPPGQQQPGPRRFERTLDDFGGDPMKYLDARDEFTRSEAIREATETIEQNHRNREAQAYEQRLDKDWQARKEEAATRNPEIREAVAFLEAQAASLSPELRYAILTDPLGPEKVHAILSSRQHAQILSLPGNMAALEFARFSGAAPATTQAPATTPVAPAPHPRAPALPRAPVSDGRGAPADDDSEDFATFREGFTKGLRRKGYTR